MGHVVLLGYLVKHMGIYVHMKKEEKKLPYCVLSQWFCFDFILMCAQHSTKLVAWVFPSRHDLTCPHQTL